MTEDIEEVHEGVLPLNRMTAAEFLKEVSLMMDMHPDRPESWLEVKFTDHWGQPRIMRLWIPEYNRDDNDVKH